MLDLEQRSGVTVVRLRHGKVNALDLEVLQAITAAMRDVDESAAVVITGSGTAFSAGVDLHRVVAGGQSYVQEFLPALSRTFMAIFDHPGPVLRGAATRRPSSRCGHRCAPGMRSLDTSTRSSSGLVRPAGDPDAPAGRATWVYSYNPWITPLAA